MRSTLLLHLSVSLAATRMPYNFTTEIANQKEQILTRRLMFRFVCLRKAGNLTATMSAIESRELFARLFIFLNKIWLHLYTKVNCNFVFGYPG